MVARELLGIAMKKKFRIITLKEVLKAAERAKEQMAKWPKWKRDLK